MKLDLGLWDKGWLAPVLLRSEIRNMYVNTCVYVVKHVPAEMVGVFIHHEIVAAIPAPIRTHGPVPIRYLEVEAAREPEAEMVAVDAFDVVAVRRAQMFKAPVPNPMPPLQPLPPSPVLP